MNTQKLQSEYDNKYTLLEQLKDTANFILDKEIKRKKLKIHSFDSRIKPFNSVLEKIQRKQIRDPFKEIHDLVALRVVCLFRSDIESIRNIIKHIFHIIEEDNKIDNTAADIFGYMGIHFTAKLKDSSFGYGSIRDMSFEVQVRTMGQDAWASISHHLYYKQEKSVPSNLRRDFYALSGLFHVADTHFEILRKEQSKYLSNKRFSRK